ncbi:MAG TPA: hypothetical protein VIT65_17025 [Microlunatus sp.]
MLLPQGGLGDRRLVPAAYIDAMITDLVDTGGHVSSRATIPHGDNATYGRGFRDRVPAPACVRDHHRSLRGSDDRILDAVCESIARALV